MPIAQAPAEGGAGMGEGKAGMGHFCAHCPAKSEEKEAGESGGGGPWRVRMSLEQEQPVHTSVERLGIWFLTRGGKPAQRYSDPNPEE